MKVTSQMRSSACLFPTTCPAKPLAELHLLALKAHAAARDDGDIVVVKRVVEAGQTPTVTAL